MSFIIETERLILRPFIKEDARDLFVLNNDSKVLQYTGDEPFNSCTDALAFIDQYDEYEKNGMGRWAALLKSDLSFLGWCGLKKHESGLIDLGFRFKQKYWGMGYATEAAQASIKYGFDELNIEKILGRAERANIASVRVLRKVGMQKVEGEVKLQGFNDPVVYSILRNRI